MLEEQESRKDLPHDGASNISTRSSRSGRSSVSTAATKARAIAEAARARAAFAEKEKSITLEKAKLEANLDALKYEREAAAANAQAEVLEAAAELEDVESQSRRSPTVPVQNIQERVSAYVREQNSNTNAFPEPIRRAEPSEGSIEPRDAPTPQVFREKEYILIDSWPPAPPQIHQRSILPHTNTLSQIKGESDHLNVKAKVFSPKYADTSHPNRPETSVMMDMAKYLARKELISTGLKHFDDCPETYRAWKSSFFNTIRDLDLTASEHLDLLSKWLGKESADHVRRLRAVNISNPVAALKAAWERLDDCYGAPEVIESALFSKLDNFPKISNKDNYKLRELGDLLSELLSAKEDGYLSGLAYLDTARGIKPIVEKLPHNLQEKWLAQGSRYKESHQVSYPPFSYFTSFICYQAKTRNDPSFTYSGNNLQTERTIQKRTNTRTTIAVHKTTVAAGTVQNDTASRDDVNKLCPIHQKPHPLKKCRGFRLMTLEDRKAYLKEQGICFKCCSSSSHLARDCKVTLKCEECDSESHVTALHPGPPKWARDTNPPQDNGGEQVKEEVKTTPVVSPLCTKVCGDQLKAKSCSKICLVKVYPKTSPDKAVKMYAMLDDQSNKSLARSQFFNIFKIKADKYPYTLKTCAGLTTTSGRRAIGYQIEAVNGGTSLPLPELIECEDLPDNRDEIPTPEAAFHHPHLEDLAKEIPDLDKDAHILLLLGRDILRAHKVREQINGPGDTPFAQRLDLGWVLVGDVCLGKVHKPMVYSYKTNILEDGRPSLFTPCVSHVYLKEAIRPSLANRHTHGCCNTMDTDSLGLSVFARTVDDDKRAHSIEDKQFLKVMDKQVFQDESNSWVAPLPFKSPRPPLPNNRNQALTRLSSLLRTLERKPKMKEQFVAFMQKVFHNNHAELAPSLQEGSECWYLPSFGVYHPRKPDQIRVVFDSSAQCNGISLNNVLLTGPDLNNSLLGVLIRFRRESIAVMADIEQMFHCFVVREDHRDYLRFLWFRENDPSKDIVEYRMRVHVFGNSPSPAVATYCLRRAAKEGEQEYGSDTKHFVEREFYVDDGLMSTPTKEEAITLLQKTQASLAESNLRLHKITSNSIEVLKAFPAGDHAKDIQDLYLGAETVAAQRSLGLSWEVKTDTFTFQVSISDKPFTRRGVLSTINSLFDPLGFVAPVTVQGKSLLRELTSEGTEWDAPLPQDKLNVWQAWRDSLQELQNLHIPRAYSNTSPSKAKHREICVFSDASTKAIGAVAYLKTTDHDGQGQVGFILGKAKLTPSNEPTIPRLELCAAVLAVEMAELITQEIDLPLDAVTFYCDSKVVLGYVHNQSKRFYVYVHNRVQRIRQSTEPKQWRYVPTEHNPADHASRFVQASLLTKTNWFTGPAFLRKPDPVSDQHPTFELINPDSDVDIRPQVTSCITSHSDKHLDPEKFERFSSWKSLQRAVAILTHMAHSFTPTNSTGCKGWHQCRRPQTPDELSRATTVILSAVQRACFPEELNVFSNAAEVNKKSPLSKLNPVIGPDGLLRIGGRLKQADLSDQEKHPIILPGKHHVSTLLIRHYHEQVEHQGRTFTEGAVRSAGFWLIGGKRRISSILHGCVTCRKLCGRRESQKMSDLPQERLSTSPPFTYTGVDVFGPWFVTTRRTRGGVAQNKRWAVLFTCLSTRAVHIEVIESMDTSSFINSLRRFFALRGPSEQLHSDCGTNFVGACKELEFHLVLKESEVQKYTNSQGCSWHFNPPHSSHRGGAWERMIGVARRILDSMLMRTHSSSLTHEVLCTLMAEVTSIINSRPLVSVSSDPEVPQILTPAMLLTRKQSVPPPLGKFSDKDLHKQQWRQVQRLADQFWSRWKREYLQTLIKTSKDGYTKKFLRPVSEVILLLKNKD